MRQLFSLQGTDRSQCVWGHSEKKKALERTLDHAGCSKDFIFRPMCQEKPAEGLSARMTLCDPSIPQHGLSHRRGSVKGCGTSEKTDSNQTSKGWKLLVIQKESKISVFAQENKQFA